MLYQIDATCSESMEGVRLLTEFVQVSAEYVKAFIDFVKVSMDCGRTVIIERVTLS